MPGITNPAEPYFKDGVWGWDGSAWHKLPMLWGYSSRWAESVNGVAVDAGDATANTAGVDPDYVYVLQGVAVQHNAGADKPLQVFVYTGAVDVQLLPAFTATDAQVYAWHGEIVLAEGDVVRGIATAPGDGKRCYLRTWGYKMKIAE